MISFNRLIGHLFVAAAVIAILALFVVDVIQTLHIVAIPSAIMSAAFFYSLAEIIELLTPISQHYSQSLAPDAEPYSESNGENTPENPETDQDSEAGAQDTSEAE